MIYTHILHRQYAVKHTSWHYDSSKSLAFNEIIHVLQN